MSRRGAFPWLLPRESVYHRSDTMRGSRNGISARKARVAQGVRNSGRAMGARPVPERFRRSRATTACRCGGQPRLGGCSVNPDRGLLVPVALMLIVVLASWLGIAGTVLKEGKENGLYHLLLDWQTLIGAMIALVAALVAVRPVRRQVAEMRIQSAMQTYEHLRSRATAIERERALTWQARLEAGRMGRIVQSLRSVDQQSLLKVQTDELAKRLDALEVLSADCERAGFEKWGSPEAALGRLEFVAAISGLKVTLATLRLDVLKIQEDDAVRWASNQSQLRNMKVPDASAVLVDKAKAFLTHVDAEAVRLARLMNRLVNKTIVIDAFFQLGDAGRGIHARALRQHGCADEILGEQLRNAIAELVADGGPS
jgi:hypothetical protein